MAELDTVARPYARAAFASALDGDALPAWGALLVAAAAGALDPAFRPLIGDPHVPADALADILAEVGGADERGRAFLRLLAARKRLAALPAIHAQFEALRAEHEHRVDVEVVSAFDLTAAQQGKFERALEKRLGRKVVIAARTDASLLGGAILRAGDLVIDGSVKGRLEKLAASL